MADVTVEEIESLQREFDWVLNTEVKSVINQLKEAVQVQATFSFQYLFINDCILIYVTENISIFCKII